MCKLLHLNGRYWICETMFLSGKDQIKSLFRGFFSPLNYLCLGITTCWDYIVTINISFLCAPLLFGREECLRNQALSVTRQIELYLEHFFWCQKGQEEQQHGWKSSMKAGQGWVLYNRVVSAVTAAPKMTFVTLFRTGQCCLCRLRSEAWLNTAFKEYSIRKLQSTKLSSGKEEPENWDTVSSSTFSSLAQN